MNEILENKKLKEFPFDIPQGYFSTLEERVRAKMECETESKSVRVWRILKATVALAAAFLLIIGLGGVILKYTTGEIKSNNLSIAEQTDEEITDSLQSIILTDRIYAAVVEGEDVEDAYNLAIENVSEEIITSEEFDEMVREYLNSSPTTYSNLLAGELGR